MREKQRYAMTVGRKANQTDWKDTPVVRIDLTDHATKQDVHLYVRSGHPLAQLVPGEKVKIVTGIE